jgi:low temperature requirement protein LtrA
MTPRPHLFRDRATGDHAPVTYIELFFDLVFVFAITQLSHRLLDHLSPHGALETLILLLAVWWVWVYTSWTTNWLDPDRANVRLMLLAVMAGGLALAVAVPDAFEDNGLLFAAAYCAMQIGRTGYMVWASRGVNEARKRNFQRIVVYFLVSAPLWIGGALVEGDLRLALWSVAVAIEYAGPFLFFRVPGLGRSAASDWDISGAHMAERCALFIIIALGEAVLVTGATFAKLPHDAPTIAAFVTSFVGSATMWWIYFDVGAKRGSRMIAEAEIGLAGRVARNAYTYLHLPIVGGLIVTAVGDEKMLAHPVGHAELGFVLTAVGGPLLFLVGNQAFKWATSGQRWPPLSHGIGTVLLIALGTAGYFGHWQPLTIGMLAAATLILTAVWEWLSLHGGWQRWAPWLGKLGRR